MRQVSPPSSPLPPFELERFFAKHEFSAPYLACCSDCEPLTLQQLLQLGNDDESEANLGQILGVSLGYTETQGLPALRQAIVNYYHGPSIQPEDVCVCVPEEGVYLTMRVLLRPGDHVVCTFPGYQSLYSIAASIGCTVSKWEPEMSPAPVFHVEKLQELVKSAPTRLVVVNFPHNPTGALLSHTEWDRVLELCKDNNCYLFSDEMYRGLELNPEARLPSAADKYEHAISLNGCSKALALPGLRLGWLTCRDKLLRDQVLTLKDYTTICAAAPSEVLALMAVRAAPRLIKRNLQVIQGNIDVVKAFAAQWHSVLEFSPPVAGSVAFPRLKQQFMDIVAATHKERISRGVSVIESFADEIVAACGVLILPASVYGHENSTQSGHFRLGLGRKNLNECLDRLGQHLQKVLGA